VKPARVATAFALLLTVSLFSGGVAGRPEQSDISADALFNAGKFAEAGKLYAQNVAQSPDDFTAAVRLGHIALLSNRLDDAQKWLEKAIAIKPDAADAKIMLAEVFYRRDDFQQAVPLLPAASQAPTVEMANYSTLYFPKLASFEGLTPYEIQGQGETIRLKFVKTDPLPLVRVRKTS
jgi:cytochrome c-type biogenesis protein CcmH/NrfG